MDIGIKTALESDFDYLIKIDGDNQFENTDIKDMLKKAQKIMLHL